MSALPERIVCAANKYGDQVFCGVRHWDQAMGSTIDAALTEFSNPITEVQGFMTNKGRFVTRKEAWTIAEEQNQIIRRCGHDGPTLSGLFSENLY